jgi:glycosyltransferase involved in cell wall biosynthesis
MAEPIRILQVVRPAEGGIQTHVVGLARHLPEPRFAVMVAGALGREFQIALSKAGITWANVAIPSEPAPRALWQAAHQLRRLIASQCPHIVHAHGYLAGLPAAWALRPLDRRPPLVLTAHVLPKPGSGEAKASRLERWAYRWLFSRIDRGIAVSNTIADAIQEYSSPGLWSVIHNGIDVSAFRRRVPAGTKRRELGVDPAAAVVGVVARLSEEKGVDVFLRAASILASELPNVDFVVVGDGPQREALEMMAHDLHLTGQLLFVGRRRDVPEILGAIDVLVVPSREESFGLVALEGVAAGVPTIASEVAGLREILEGVDLVKFVSPDDPRALARALKRELTTISLDEVADDDAPVALATGELMRVAEMLVSETEFNIDTPGLDRDAQTAADQGTTRREEVLARFDIRNMVRGTIALYEDVLKQGSSGSHIATTD